jgi:DNA-binding NtrC family response regulator
LRNSPNLSGKLQKHTAKCTGPALAPKVLRRSNAVLTDPTRMTAPINPSDLPTELTDERGGAAGGLRLVAMWPHGMVVRDLPSSGTLVLGRGDAAHVLLDHTSVSRRHATLTLGETLILEDLGSSNGTFVDGRRLAPNTPTPIRPGMLVEVGSVLVALRTGGPRPVHRATADRGDVIVLDPAMERVHELVEVVGKSNISVLLLGETGVGKEVLASRVHAASPRAGKPFLKINCAALVETLLEAELFGYERGAFTGAVTTKAGLLEGADGGTLFLDEVGELPLATQAKLLRVLESGEVTRVGGVKPRKVDVRFVAATNRDLKKQIAEGRFRQDLYYRLEGLAITVPPLRERLREIPELAHAFLSRACAEHGRAPMSFSEAAAQRLLEYRWPGNVRELKNVISRSALLCRRATIEPEDLRFDSMGASAVAAISAAGPSRTGGWAPPPTCSVPIEEQRRVLQALELCAGNQTRAAKLLGISRGTLLSRLDAMGVPRPRK